MEGELELVGKAAAGDDDAFRMLVERHGRLVYSLAYRITGEAASAEDIVQETFLRAYRALSRFDGRATFATWVHRIATNAALDLTRYRRIRQEVPYGTEDVADPAPSHDPGPERLAESGDLRRELARAMKSLSPTERTAFVLRHHEGRSTEEIGRQLGLGALATRQAVFRAVRKLRQALSPFVEDTP